MTGKSKIFSSARRLAHVRISLIPRNPCNQRQNLLNENKFKVLIADFWLLNRSIP
jgi:hypothetical protein